MVVLHGGDFNEADYRAYHDEPFFRLRHGLQGLSAPTLPEGFSLCYPALRDYAAHINQCYAGIGVTEAELRGCTLRAVYKAELWLAVKEDRTGALAATGIAELDRSLGEGILEWVQVTEGQRRRGLGCFVVSELLWRMKGVARFATVSGQCRNPTNPEGLYRRCGFTGQDVWHILRPRH